MFKRITDSKWFYIVLSILMSILLWGYVIREQDPPQNKTISGVPVTFTGVDVLETRHLILSKGAEQTMALRLQAKLDVFGKLGRDTITVRVDVAKITQPGEYSLPAQVIYPPNVQTGSVSLESSLDDLYVPFTVARSEAKEIPVKAEFMGNVAKGYQLGTPASTPSTIGISGQQEEVDKVAYARVILTQKDLSQTYVGDLPFAYIGADGKELTSLSVKSSVDTVHVSYPVVKVVNLPLAVDILYGGGITAENISKYVTVDIEPKELSVSGEEDVLSTLKQLYVGQIDLAKIVTSEIYHFPIDVGKELTNESGTTEAAVNVKLKGLTTKEFNVSNIQLINVPTGYNVEAVTQSRTVMVRGEQPAVEATFASQLRIVVDVSAGIPAAAVGRFDLPAKVYLDGGSGVGVVGTYNISVSLSR